ncbi:MAG TPA: hypothetical protein VFV38_19125 [Ktedonobacteraceae bacterium]|nr:hypothetical protein [Ktedonobacteraceae bacterium]
MIEKRRMRKMKEIIAYTFRDTAVLPPPESVPLVPGAYQGVHFTMEAEQQEWVLEKIERWFEGRDEIILVDSGYTSKGNLGYICLEWDGCQIDPLFLAILRDEEFITDFAVYTRSGEVYDA